MKPTRIPCLGKALVLFPLAMSANAAIYLESFPNSGETKGSGNIAHSNAAIGWSAYVGASAADFSNNTSSFPVSQIEGAVSGFGYGAKTAGGIGLAYTTEVAALNVTLTDIPTITFWTRNTDATDIFRVVVGIDVSGTTNWFASDQTFNRDAATSTNWELETFNVTTAGSAWRMLTFTPGSAMSLSGTTLAGVLPTGNLVTAGLFVSGAAGGNNANTIRYDEFTLVPEPSSLLLGAGGLGLLCLRRKR